MKRYKQIAYGSMVLGTSLLLLLGGCGSKETQKETTASSIKTESSSVENEESPVSIKKPFNKNYPMYVTDNNDSNRRVKAIIIPYADTNNKIKVTTYSGGSEDKSYILEYKIKEITKGNDTEPAIYRYSFYNNKDHEWDHYDAGYVKDKDIKGQVFIELAYLDKDRIKDGKVDDYSSSELKKYFEEHTCSELYDNSKYVTMK